MSVKPDKIEMFGAALVVAVSIWFRRLDIFWGHLDHSQLSPSPPRMTSVSFFPGGLDQTMPKWYHLADIWLALGRLLGVFCERFG